MKTYISDPKEMMLMYFRDVPLVHFRSQQEIDPIVVELVRCGASSWGVVPNPCFGLEKALVAVWKRGNASELGYLFQKLEPRLKIKVRTCLLLFNRCFPGAPEMQMKIIDLSLE
jgi:hypothetical protein